MTKINAKNRWALVNKNTGTVRGSKSTRDDARAAKANLGGNYGIYDTVRGIFIR